MTDVEKRLILAELRTLRDTADRLIATMECPYASRGTAVPERLLVGCICKTNCRCHPEAVKAKPRCGKCASFRVQAFDDGSYWCRECGVTSGEIAEKLALTPSFLAKSARLQDRPPACCLECQAENIVTRLDGTYYCVPCGIERRWK